MSVGSAKTTQGFADVFGGRQFNTIDYSGPTAYNNTGTPATSGDTLDPMFFGFKNTIQSIVGTSTSQDGTVYAVGQPVNNGITAWRLRWYTNGTGVEIANNVNLSTKIIKLSAVGF